MPKAKTPYDDKRWPKLRKIVFERDGGRCQSGISKRCIKGPLTLAPNQFSTMRLGHIIDWRTNGGSWFGKKNLRTECGPCSSAESIFRKNREGWKHAKAIVKLYVGPPVGLASKRAAEAAGPKDLIVDFDTIVTSLGDASDDAVKKLANDQRNALLKEVQRGETGAKVVHLVSYRSDAEDFYSFHHEVVLCDPGIGEALDFAASVGPSRVQLVRAWYRDREAPADYTKWEWD